MSIGEATRDEEAVMRYMNYLTAIVARYKIRLTGLPENLLLDDGNIKHQSYWGDAIYDHLREGFKSGLCRWVELKEGETPESTARQSSVAPVLRLSLRNRSAYEEEEIRKELTTINTRQPKRRRLVRAPASRRSAGAPIAGRQQQLAPSSTTSSSSLTTDPEWTGHKSVPNRSPTRTTRSSSVGSHIRWC